jgi:hypothetical protein
MPDRIYNIIRVQYSTHGYKDIVIRVQYSTHGYNNLKFYEYSRVLTRCSPEHNILMSSLVNVILSRSAVTLRKPLVSDNWASAGYP